MPDMLNFPTVDEVLHQFTMDNIREFVEDYWSAVPAERWSSVERYTYEGWTPEGSWELHIQASLSGVNYCFKHMGAEYNKHIQPKLMMGNPQGAIENVVFWVDNLIKDNVKGR